MRNGERYQVTVQRCLCGRAAVEWRAAGWVCAECLRCEAVYFADDYRSSCGVPDAGLMVHEAVEAEP